jgi:hypothetical protein
MDNSLPAAHRVALFWGLSKPPGAPLCTASCCPDRSCLGLRSTTFQGLPMRPTGGNELAYAKGIANDNNSRVTLSAEATRAAKIVDADQLPHSGEL